MADDVLRTRYVPLLHVRLLHHYWLDEGATSFDAIDDPARRRRLEGYDVRRILSVSPRRATTAALRDHRAVLELTSLGLTIAAPDDIRLDPSVTLEFDLTAVSADYGICTAHTLRERQLVGVEDPASHEVRRFMANVPVLSNLTGVSRGVTGSRRLFLSREYPSGMAAADRCEAIATAAGQVRQLRGDPPGATDIVLGPASALPVFVHQGDAPVLPASDVAAGPPARGIAMQADTPPDVVAVLSLTARRTSDQAFSFTAPDGRPKDPAPVFEVHLQNRWTVRRHKRRGDGSEIRTEADATPLTRHGNAGATHKPPTDSIVVERTTTAPTRITALLSDIYQ